MLVYPSSSYLPHHYKNILFLSDSGMETQLVFHQSEFVLREFSAFELLSHDQGCDYLRKYYRHHVQLVTPVGQIDEKKDNDNDTKTNNNYNDDHENGRKLGFVLESVLWRANPDWLLKLGYSPEKDLAPLCQKAMSLLQEIQNEFPHVPMIKSGTIGPRSDGYNVANQTIQMSVEQAQDYHGPQIRAMQQAGADIVTAMTMNYMNEAIGVALAAQQVGIPVVVSFTVETNGCLVTGETLPDAIETVDRVTNGYPVYYMINCAHPTHFLAVVAGTTANSVNGAADTWKSRLGGIRANASCKSHAELDECEELDDGDPQKLGQEYQQLLQALPSVNVVGGCCGTDYRHILEIKLALTAKEE